MVWENIIVLLLVTASFAYIAYSSWKTWFGRKSGCGGSCACEDKSEKFGSTSKRGDTFIPLESIVLREKGRSSE